MNKTLWDTIKLCFQNKLSSVSEILDFYPPMKIAMMYPALKTDST